MPLFYVVQGNKNIKIILKSSLGFLLFAYMGYSLYRQIQQQDHLKEALTQLFNWHDSTRWFYLLLVLILMGLNWFCEAEKWRLLMRSTETISRKSAIQSVLTGLSVSMLTPNRIGEYAGRILYLKNKHKLKGITITLVGSLAQVIASAILGTLGLLVYYLSIETPTFMLLTYISLSLLLALALSFFYLNLQWVSTFCARFEYLRKVRIYVDVVRRLPHALLLNVLTISVLRFLIYSTQLVILFYFVHIEAPFFTLMSFTWAIFWTLAVVPTIALAELGVRGQTAVFFMSALSTNTLGIVSAMLLLWFINLIIPALSGCFFVWNMKLYDDE